MELDYTKSIVRRSRLIFPANQQKYVEKAYLRNADALVLDLEDSVPHAEKLATRKIIKDSLHIVGKSGSDIFVRVNNTKELLSGDIEASVWPGLDGIYVPKVESSAEIQAIAQHIAELELKRSIPEGHVKISIIVETLRGYINRNEIAQAHGRVDTLTLGNEDFLRDTGMVEDEETFHGFLIPRMQLLFTSRAYGKVPMGLLGSLANYSNSNSFEKSASLAYKHGFLGASCIHPGNVEILNKCFSPSSEEIDYSRKVIAAFESALATGRASASLEGKMIDYVHYDRAQTVLERKAKIKEFELKKEKAREAILGGLKP